MSCRPTAKTHTDMLHVLRYMERLLVLLLVVQVSHIVVSRSKLSSI